MDLLTVKDVSKELGVSVWRVHQLIKAGRLPVVKLGSQYVIKKSDLQPVRDRKPGRPASKNGKDIGAKK